jgi:glutathione S-transferase
MPSIVLHQYPPVPGNLSLSPFCCKVHAALRLRGLEYQVQSSMFSNRVNRYGQFPMLEWDGEQINDSTEIVRAIDARTRPERPFFPADPALAAEVTLLEDWADESLYWYGVYAKFWDDEGWAATRPELVQMLPAPLRPLGPLVARRRAQRRLQTQGMLRRSRSQLELEMDRLLDALERRIDGRRYLVGDAPTAADLSVVAVLAQPVIGHTAFFGQRVARRPKLTEYLKRFRAESRTEA